jgi:argininosuccinate lyase
MPFDPEYTARVLRENFEDAKALFLSSLIDIHYAHLIMLHQQHLLSAADAHVLRSALDAIPLAEIKAVAYDQACEDLFFYIERFLVARCGEDVAGRLRIARSRNDIDMTMYRMRQRELLSVLCGHVLDLRVALLALAAQHRETLFAAHTHTQPAQPTTVAHYLLAVIEQLERDFVRMRAAYASTNRSPLGACAITGTGFPIDRQVTSELLGFDEPSGNTYGSIATVDYLLEAVAATQVLLAGLGRVVQDLLLWCTQEVGYLRLADGLVQGSSIMPQKRNPVALEHTRSLTSKALGQAIAIVTAVHNTPFGDIVDTEDDLQPLVASMFRDAQRAVALLAATIHGAEINVERMHARVEQGGTTSTELADRLVRDHGIPFNSAHAIAAAYVSGDPNAALARYTRDELACITSARNFVDVRNTPGGPAPGETARALAASHERARVDREWLERVHHKIDVATSTRKQRAAEL